MRFLGILREPLHSPNRESDDEKILRAVAAELERRGIESRVVAAEEGPRALREFAPDVAAPMCEARPALARLVEAGGDALFVNTPQGVLNCYRTSMVPFLSACPDADFPRTELRPVGAGRPAPAFLNGEGMWVKRGDVHNTCDHDVVRVSGMDELARVEEDFRSRGIEDLVLQEHLAGDLLKFYGVGPGEWGTWFYHDPSKAAKHPFDPAELERRAGAAAAAVGLEVYGGDAIVTPDGRIRLIDINSWPSFARVRSEASLQIARHLAARCASLEAA